MHIRRNRTLHSVLAAGGLTLAVGLAGSAAFASDQPLERGVGAEAQLAARPDVPQRYAQAVFDAWIAVDQASLADLATPEVVQLLAAAPVDGWVDGPGACDGAAGSTYCTWIGGDLQVTVRVANEAASGAEAHAAVDATFAPTPDSIAVWPVTTTNEASSAQDEVDAGHSPWLIDPETVVSSYASAELDFARPVVEQISATFPIFRVVDATTGAAVDVGLAQPARSGAGGIWAIDQATSVPDGPVAS